MGKAKIASSFILAIISIGKIDIKRELKKSLFFCYVVPIINWFPVHNLFLLPFNHFNLSPIQWERRYVQNGSKSTIKKLLFTTPCQLTKGTKPINNVNKTM